MRAFLEGFPVMYRSGTHKYVCQLGTDNCVQEMSYVMGVLQSLELKLKLPVLLDMDNNGAVDLANNWS